jgi:hypothetical protein
VRAQVAPAPAAAPAMSVAQHIAAGDSATAALDARAAYEQFQAALALDSTDYGALWRASREAVSLGEFDSSKTQQRAYYAQGAAYARRAVAVNATGTEGWFVLARALGRTSLTMSSKERVKYAKEIREAALNSLRYDALNAGALHVLGMWNAEIRRLGGLSRFFAENFLGGEIFHAASWDSAVYYMNKSVKVEPQRLVHHLDLGLIYIDRDAKGDEALGKEQLQVVVDGKPTEYNDQFYKKQAAAALAKLPQ